jgi:WD40 repeat protein
MGFCPLFSSIIFRSTDAFSSDVHLPLTEKRASRRVLRRQVRSVCGLESGAVASASRDWSIRVWVPKDTGYELSKTLVGHQHYVSVVISVPPVSWLPEGGLLSGSSISLAFSSASSFANRLVTCEYFWTRCSGSIRLQAVMTSRFWRGT